MTDQIPEILFKDRDILIINKPADILSVPDGYDPDLPHIKSVLAAEFDNLWMVHRLDKETSGVIVLARNSETHRKLNECFKNRAVEKYYHCLVHPAPEWQHLDIQLPLQVDADRKHRTRVDEILGKPAVSICAVKKRFNSGALLEINIHTGVTHQIRAHLRANNLAIFGDELYSAGLPKSFIRVPRMMLHARKIIFSHPTTQKIIEITANYPEDFRQAYTALRMTTKKDGSF